MNKRGQTRLPCQSFNKNAFQQDVYQPLVDRMLESASWGRSGPGGGVPGPGGLSAPGGVWSQGVPGPGGVCSGECLLQGYLLWGCLLWGCLLWGGVCSGGVYPSMH